MTSTKRPAFRGSFYGEPKRIPPTLDDLWDQMARTAAAKAVASWLKGSVNIQRPIQSLSLTEMQSIAQEAISTYLLLASQRKPDTSVAIDVMKFIRGG